MPPVESDEVSKIPNVTQLADDTELGIVEYETHENNVFSKNANGPDFRGVSWFGAAVLITKSQIGLGVLALPQTFQVMGFFPGLLCLTIFCILSTWTGVVVGRFRLRHPQVHSVGDATLIMFGRAGFELIGFVNWLYYTLSYGGALLTVSIAFNAMSEHAICTIGFVGIGASVIFVIALLTRTMKHMSWCGYVALVSCTVSIWLVAIACLAQSVPAAAPAGEPINKDIVALPKGSSYASVASAIGAQVFSVSGTPSFFTIHAEMKDQKKYVRSLLVGQGYVSFTYIVVSCILYGKVGQYVASPALGSAGPFIEKIAYGLALPALFFSGFFFSHIAAKSALVRILRSTKHLQDNSMTHLLTWFGMVSLVIVIGFVIAGSIPFFGDLLGLIGGLFGTIFVLIIPGFMSLHMLASDGGHGLNSWLRGSLKTWARDKRSSMVASVAWFCIIIGCYVSASAVYGSVASIVDEYASGAVGSAFSCQDNS
jgi:amino acid permease